MYDVEESSSTNHEPAAPTVRPTAIMTATARLGSRNRLRIPRDVDREVLGPLHVQMCDLGT